MECTTYCKSAADKNIDWLNLRVGNGLSESMFVRLCFTNDSYSLLDDSYSPLRFPKTLRIFVILASASSSSSLTIVFTLVSKPSLSFIAMWSLRSSSLIWWLLLLEVLVSSMVARLLSAFAGIRMLCSLMKLSSFWACKSWFLIDSFSIVNISRLDSSYSIFSSLSCILSLYHAILLIESFNLVWKASLSLVT